MKIRSGLVPRMTGRQPVKGVSVSHRALLVTVFVLALGSAAPTALADNPMLVGNVGANDAYSIALGDANGNAVTRLDPGTYTLVIHDHSAIHNFHLSGPGVDVSSTVPEIGDKTFTITLTNGKYVFDCDAHFSRMNGTFLVGTAAPPPTPTPKPKPVVQKLSAGISAAGRTSLVRPAKLVAGAARITVKDSSAKDGFRLVGPGFVKSTGVAFRGTVTWKLTLRAGRYTISTAKHPKTAAGRFVVAPKS